MRREWLRGMNARAEGYQRRVEGKGSTGGLVSTNTARRHANNGFATSFELPDRGGSRKGLQQKQKAKKRRRDEPLAQSKQSFIREQHRKISALQQGAPSRLENVAYVDKIEMVLLGACASWTLSLEGSTSLLLRRLAFVGIVGLLYLFNRLSAGSRSFFIRPERYRGLYGAMASFTWSVIVYHINTPSNFFVQSLMASVAFFFSYTLRLQLRQQGSLKGFWLSIVTGEVFKHMSGAGQPVVRYMKAHKNK